MSLVSDIRAIIEAKYPNSVFVLSSDFKANVNSYYNAPYTVAAPLIILDNELEEQNDIAENITFNVQTKIKLTFLSKDTINDSTDQQVNDNVIEPLKTVARSIYGAIYRLDSIRFNENETGRFSLKPLFRTYNSVLSGVVGEARWRENVVTNVCFE